MPNGMAVPEQRDPRHVALGEPVSFRSDRIVKLRPVSIGR